MHVIVSTTFPQAVRPEIERLVRAGFEGVECCDVEAHVKARSRVRRTYVAEWPLTATRSERYRFRRRRDAEEFVAEFGGTLWRETTPHPRATGWSARTFGGVPGVARVRAGARYLVTFMIPADPRRLTGYPVVHQDPRLKTSPVVTFDCWAEQLLYVAAHEARHVHQFRHGLSRSEKDAEVWAAARLADHRHPPLVDRPLPLEL